MATQAGYETIECEEIEELDLSGVDQGLLEEISRWKREARAEDNERYFWHVREADQIARGERYFVIGRKGSGKTALCEYFSRRQSYDTFAEKLSFKNFPFNELYAHGNQLYTPPNQFITIWKYLIYSSVCRLMIRDEAVDAVVRQQLSTLFEENLPLNRRLGRWVGKEFGFSLFGLSAKIGKTQPEEVKESWIERASVLEDLVLQYASAATYFVLFDELDEDYRDILEREQYSQYVALITSLFKAVQDVRNNLASREDLHVFPVIFLRDDIYELIQDSDKNKWGDFKVDLNWDVQKIKKVIAFRISRAIDPTVSTALPFDKAWQRVFGTRRIGMGSRRGKMIGTFEYIARSTLLRPRDFVAYLQNCAQHAIDDGAQISPEIVRRVDKAFSNYLRNELCDELFAILPDINAIFDAISQLRKWNFSIGEFERVYESQAALGFVKQGNFRFVLQVLYLFSVIGNTPRPGRFVFRYQNPEARLNFNERVVVHRGLFKSLQIL